MMLDLYSATPQPAGGFNSLTAEQQSHLLKWAALLPPAAASAVPCAPSPPASRSDAGSTSDEDPSEGASTMSWSPPPTPGRKSASPARSHIFAHEVESQAWTMPALPSLELFGRSKGSTGKGRGSFSSFRNKDKRD